MLMKVLETAQVASYLGSYLLNRWNSTADSFQHTKPIVTIFLLAHFDWNTDESSVIS